MTDASVHDSQATDKLLDEKKDMGEPFYADSVYPACTGTFIVHLGAVYAHQRIPGNLVRKHYPAVV